MAQESTILRRYVNGVGDGLEGEANCEALVGRQARRDSKGTGLQMNSSTVRLRG